MESSDSMDTFDPYTYEGSPSVKTIYGYIATVIGFLFFWGVNYVLVVVGPPKNMKGDIWRWRNTFVSWIHADIVGVGVIYCDHFFLYSSSAACVLAYKCFPYSVVYASSTNNSLLFKPGVLEDVILYCDYFIYIQLAFSLGYFLYDFYDHVLNKKLFTNYQVILHHIAVIWVFAYNVHYRANVAATVIALMTEVNSIFLHARKLMQFVQWPSDHWRYRLAVLLNFVTFIVFRMYGVTIVSLSVYREWRRLTAIYRGCMVVTMCVMFVINPILLWRLFKSDVLRHYKKVNQKVDINGSVNGYKNGCK